MQLLLEKRKKELQRICQTLKIKRLYAFGSVVSVRFNEKSDINFLISFHDNLSVEEYTNNYFSLHYQLQDLFKQEIEIVTERTLSNPYFIKSINESKELIYENKKFNGTAYSPKAFRSCQSDSLRGSW